MSIHLQPFRGARSCVLYTILCVFSLVTPAVADPADDVLPKQVVILQIYGTSNGGPQTVTWPKDVILQTITVMPASIDTDPNLFNCAAVVRWPSEGKSPAPAIDPVSNGDVIIDYSWEGAKHVSLNYSLPYELVLPKGTDLEADIGRVGTAGNCDAMVVFTGTTF